MKTKRQNNTIGLKVAFIPCTNTKPNRLKLTQTNNNKSIFISGNNNKEIVHFICDELDKIKEIKSFNIVIDNTQNKYYLFSIDFKTNEISEILENFKNS